MLTVKTYLQKQCKCVLNNLSLGLSLVLLCGLMRPMLSNKKWHKNAFVNMQFKHFLSFRRNV